MIHNTCFKCKRRFELDPTFVGFELNKLKKKNPSYYQAICPACRAVNKISISAMQEELDSVTEEVQKMIAEEEAKAEAEKKAKAEEKAKAEAEKEKKGKGKAEGKEKAKAGGKA